MTAKLKRTTWEEEHDEYPERPKERWELVEDKVNDLLFDTEELNELVHETGTLDDLSAFVRGDDDAIWGLKKRILAAAKQKAERLI